MGVSINWQSAIVVFISDEKTSENSHVSRKFANGNSRRSASVVVHVVIRNINFGTSLVRIASPQ